MPYKKTIITVYCDFIKEEIPITYSFQTKEQALERFYKTQDHTIGKLISVDQYTVYTLSDVLKIKIVNFFRRICDKIKNIRTPSPIQRKDNVSTDNSAN